MKNPLMWWPHLVRSPRRVGSIAPSSTQLADHVARRIAEFAACDPGVKLIEVGAGTGAITHALMKFVAPEAMTLIEADPGCCQYLRRRFPGVRVVEGLVENVTDGLVQPQDKLVLVSSVPLFSLSNLQRNLVLSAYERIIQSAGRCRMVQYTYVPWLPGARVQQLCGMETGSVWRNLPPAWVWSATHEKDSNQSKAGEPVIASMG